MTWLQPSLTLWLFLASSKEALEHHRSSVTQKSHLLQQRSGLLRNELGDVESGVAADSRWMAPQQRLRKDGRTDGGGGGKNRQLLRKTKKTTTGARAEESDTLTPAAQRGQRRSSGSGQIGGG